MAERLQKPDTAPTGTYRLLESLGEIKDERRNETKVYIEKEVFCQETGGSCIDVQIFRDKGREDTQLDHLHITESDRIVNIERHIYDERLRHCWSEPPPEIGEILQIIREQLDLKE